MDGLRSAYHDLNAAPTSAEQPGSASPTGPAPDPNNHQYEVIGERPAGR